MNLSFIFTDHMVLQADLPIRIFGEGAGRAEVSFCGSFGAVESNGENWLITLPAMPYGGPYEMRVTLNGEQTILREIPTTSIPSTRRLWRIGWRRKF